MINNSVTNINNNSSIANSTKDQSISTANTSEALTITNDISDKNKIKNDLKTLLTITKIWIMILNGWEKTLLMSQTS